VETTQALITLELYGVPQILAGQRSVALRGETLSALAAALAAHCPALSGPVLDAESDWLRNGYTFVVDGRFSRDPALPLNPGAAVLLVSSAAGG
jgi:molybdopterin converting factor small subunit